MGGRVPSEFTPACVEGRADAGQPGVQGRAADLYGVYRDLAGQLRLSPTSLNVEVELWYTSS